jgi:hypothetical protein
MHAVPAGGLHRRRACARLRASRQRGVQRAVDEVVHQPRFAEAHFVLGRVHVDVDPARIEFQEQHVGRLAAMEQHVGVGLASPRARRCGRAPRGR